MRSPAAAFDLRAALSNEINDAIAELTTVSAKAKAIHRCRVHLKRARALARVGSTCAPGLATVFNDSARSVMHALSTARDLDALAQAARDTAKKAKKKQASALNLAADHLEDESALLPPPDLDDAHSALRDLLALAHVWPEASPRQIRRGAERIIHRARRACRRGRGSETSSERHEWRKREKDRLYTAELLGASWPDRRKKRRKRSAKLGQALGIERDNLLLLDRLERQPSITGDERATRAAAKAVRRRLAQLSRRADDLGLKLHAKNA